MLLALALLLSAPVCPAKGAVAPRFNLPLARGGRISLSDLLVKKRATLVSFWRYDCKPCVAELPALQKLVGEWGEKVSAIAVHVGGSEEKMLAFLDEKHVLVPAAFDQTEKVSHDRFCVDSLPRLFVLDGKGAVAAILSGEQPDFEKALRAAVEPLLR
jgi:peroxiredoxin